MEQALSVGVSLGAGIGMRFIRTLLWGAVLLGLTRGSWLMAQDEQAYPADPTFRVTSRLVVLDVTVLDKTGHPVVSGLTQDDFTVTEDKKPQHILSFDAPTAESADPDTAEHNPTENSPKTIFVFDVLNSRFEDLAYYRYSLRKYLVAQPTTLESPAELMQLGSKSLEMLQGYTRNTADLLYALDHMPKEGYESSHELPDEMLSVTIKALQEIALQNEGIPGRKNIVWLGHGGPSARRSDVMSSEDTVRLFTHGTTNMLVNARMSLFLIYPGLKGAVNPDSFRIGQRSVTSATESDDDDPFSGDINMGLFVNGTGGKLFHDRNDIDAEIKQSQDLGSDFYTLTYRPPGGDADGRFRRIRVTLRDPNLQVLTKTGYYAPDHRLPDDSQEQSMYEAARSTIPFDALKLTIVHVVRHPDSGTAELTMLLKSTHMDWEAAENGKSATNVAATVVSLNGRGDIVASRMQGFNIFSNTQDATRLAGSASLITMTIRVPRPTERACSCQGI
jgi:VWFA-related protein